MLLELVPAGTVDSLTHAVEAYKAFDLRKPGWMKVSKTV